MATAFAQAGADIIVASRKADRCEETSREIEELTGRQAYPFGAHVGRWQEIDRLVEAAYARFGKVDVLVNNAGMAPSYDRVTDINEHMWDAVQNVNLKGPFRLMA